MGVNRPLALLVLLVLLAPCTAAARGRNVGGQASQVLLVITDDVSTCALAGFDCAEPDPLETPALDSITAVKVSATYTAPLCGPTRAELHAMGFATSTWYTGLAATGGGKAPYDAPWSARMLAAAGVPARLHGKGHFQTDAGYCSDDDAPCFYDETCGGGEVCEFALPTLEESKITGLLDTGWELDGMIPANAGDYLAWTSAAGSPDPGRDHSFSQAAETTYRDDVTVAEAAAWIEARAAGSPWLTVVNLANPHIPYHLPPGHSPVGDCTVGAGDTETDCFAPMLDESYNGALAYLLGAVDPARTCVIVMADNGTQDQVNQTVMRGKKGDLWEGGIRVPSHWSRACFGRGIEADPSIEVSHVDVMRFALELVGAYDPTAWEEIPASAAWDPRVAAPRVNQTSDLQSWARGYCSGEGCRDRTGKLAHLAMDQRGNAVYVLNGYKLLRSFVDELDGAPESLYALPDELTDLCAGDCAGNLTGPALAAYQAIYAQFDRLHGPARPAELSVLSFSHSSGTLSLTSGANDFHVSNARGDDLAADWNLNLTAIVCDLDMGLGLGVERFAAQPTQTLVGTFSSQITITKTYSVPGSYEITGTCFDALEPSDVLAVSGTWTL
jgi:arylsulfatase A-like enzyme